MPNAHFHPNLRVRLAAKFPADATSGKALRIIFHIMGEHPFPVALFGRERTSNFPIARSLRSRSRMPTITSILNSCGVPKIFILSLLLARTAANTGNMCNSPSSTPPCSTAARGGMVVTDLLVTSESKRPTGRVVLGTAAVQRSQKRYMLTPWRRCQVARGGSCRHQELLRAHPAKRARIQMATTASLAVARERWICARFQCQTRSLLVPWFAEIHRECNRI